MDAHGKESQERRRIPAGRYAGGRGSIIERRPVRLRRGEAARMQLPDRALPPESGAKKPARPAKRGRRPMSTDEFVRRARLIHGDRYDYGQVEYIRNDRKVCIICPIHGPFQQMPFKHLSGSGCSHPECANAKRVATNMSRYGARAILQVDQFREKRQETVRSRYGVDSVMQSASVKEKWRASREKGRGVKQKPSYQWPWDTPGSDGSRVGDGEPDDD